MHETIDLHVHAEEAGQRLDAFVASRIGELSRSRAQSLIEQGVIQVNGRNTRASLRLSEGDRVGGIVSPPPGIDAVPQSISLHVVYRDSDLAIIDKPAGLVVHPAPGHRDGTLANALAALFPQTSEVGTPERPGIVHRLDKDTSGLMVVALTEAAQRSLQQQLSERTAGREYTALIMGHPHPPEGVIDAPIGRDRDDRTRMAVYGLASRPARTVYRVDEAIGRYSLLHLQLQSGRTHQIRVHLAALGHPIAGDATYGGPTISGLHRQFLHATGLHLKSPSSGEPLSFDSELPGDLADVLQHVRTESGL